MENNQGNKSTGWVIFGILVVIVVVLIIVFAKKPNDNVASAETIKIGFVAPLSGDAASYGQAVREGVELALADVNSKGQKFEVIFEDGKCAGKDAVSATQKLINVDKVKYIIGGACSGETMAMAPVVESAKVLIMSPVSSNAQISTIGDYIFRNHPSDSEAGATLADLTLKNGSKKIAVISEQTDYAQGIRKIFFEKYQAGGGEVVVDESFTTGVTDFRTILVKVKSAAPDAIFINPQTEGAAIQIATQLKALGITAQLYGAYFTGEAVQKSGVLENIIMVDLPGVGSSGPATKFSNDFKVKYSKDPNYPYFAAAGYDVLHIFNDAIEKVGDDTEKVKSYLYDIKNYDGAAGKYHFDANGDVVGVQLTTKQLKNGAFVPYP